MYKPTEAEKQIINIIENEKSHWEEGESWVTDRVTFLMRNIILKSRKNYFGIFDNDTDPVTGRKKMFIPMTEWTVENVLKNIDIDTRDIGILAKNPNAYKTSFILRKVLQKKLDDVHFGKTLNDLLRQVVIDGTCFLKAWKEGNELKIRLIDRLNMYVDPSSESVHDSSGVIERNVLTLPEFQEYKDWDNTEEVKGEKNINRSGIDALDTTQQTEIPYVEVFERYGFLPKSAITGDMNDKEEYVYALAVVSGLDGEQTIVHKVKEVKGLPYQEFKFKEILNRFDGRGIPEILFSIQAYVNETVNTRLNVARMSQQKLWKVRGSITPQQLKNLFQTQAIKFKGAADDVEMIDTGQIDPSSYKDEDQANEWSKRVTQTQLEDEIAPSKPATNALIEERGASKSYNLIIEGIALNLQRFLEDRVIPIIRETISDGEIIRITGDPTEMNKFSKELAENMIYKDMEKFKKKFGFYPFVSEQDMDAEINRVVEELGKNGGDRFAEVNKKMFDTEFDVRVVITDEQVNRGIMANTLLQVIPLMAQAGMPIKEELKELFEVLGLDSERMIMAAEEQQQQQPAQQAQPNQPQQVSPREQVPQTEGEVAANAVQ